MPQESKIFKELQHKVRQVSDLIRYIGNKMQGERTPNFSLFLGSGASVTSGIKSGATLIDEWKRDIYEEECLDKDVDVDKFIEKQPWFDASNPYSCLFEKRFDLQRQRRAFVEREVADKNPSLGYAYLVRLIEDGYFNTIFTTNFDDLLNEAFYRFSQKRPIVCAHDSSISGVTVTSTRPKIIKLHGDYLFENIKATLRETESLEDNMKLKFQEFSKDFGMIVVGYSGCDRSIMDTLNALLRRDDNFKNGIYWCIRKGDTIGFELQKLLWKDRVYLVEIDGFDELFAEIFVKLKGIHNPINKELISLSYQQKIINQLTDVAEEQKKSQYIAESCRAIKEQLSRNVAGDFEEFIKDRDKKTEKDKGYKYNDVSIKSELKSMTEEQKKEISSFYRGKIWGFSEEQFSYSLDTILQQENSKYKLELLELYAENKNKLDEDSIKTVFDHLIDLNPQFQRYYIVACNRSQTYTQQLYFMEKALNAFPNDYTILNRYVDLILCRMEDLVSYPNLSADIERLNQIIDKSIELNSTCWNDAYEIKARLILLQYANDADKKETQINQLKAQFKGFQIYSIPYLTILKLVKDKDYNSDNIKKAISFLKQADAVKALETAYILLIDSILEESKDIESVKQFYDEFEKEYNPSDSYKNKKANVYLRYCKFDEAEKIASSLQETEDVSMLMMKCLHYQNKDESTYYEQIKDKTEQIIRLHNELLGDYSALCDIYSKFAASEYTKDILISYSFALLKCSKYLDVEKLLKPSYDNPHLTDGAIIVNYLYAKYHNDKIKLSDKIKDQFDRKPHLFVGNFEQFAVNLLMKNKKEAQTSLKKIITSCPMQKYIIRTWAILDNPNDYTELRL